MSNDVDTCYRRSDTILGPFCPDSLRAQRFQTLTTLLFEDRWVSNQIKNEGYLKLEKAVLRFLAQNIKRQQSYDLQRIRVKSSSVGHLPFLAVSSIVHKPL